MFWRRGEPTAARERRRGERAMMPLDRMTRRLPFALLAALLASAAADAQLLREPSRGEAVERHLPGDRTFTQWVHDPSDVNTQGRRPNRGARGRRRGARDRQAHESRAADPVRVGRRRDSRSDGRRAARDPRRHARSAQRAPAPRRPCRHAAAVAGVGGRVRRQRGPVARARGRGRRAACSGR